jgi:hypothetical protein
MQSIPIEIIMSVATIISLYLDDIRAFAVSKVKYIYIFTLTI